MESVYQIQTIECLGQGRIHNGGDEGIRDSSTGDDTVRASSYQLMYQQSRGHLNHVCVYMAGTVDCIVKMGEDVYMYAKMHS